MSRTIRNERLAALCRANGIRLSDLAVALETSRYCLCDYARSRRPMPHIESRLADLCGMSAAEMHVYLFTRAGRCHAASPPRIVSIGPGRAVWSVAASGRERWYADRTAYAACPQFEELRRNGRHSAHGAHIIARALTPRAATLQLFSGPPPKRLIPRSRP